MTARMGPRFGQRVARHIGAQLVAGLIVIIPIIITYLVLRWLFYTFDNVLQPVLKLTLDRAIPGAGLVALLIIIYLLGIVTSNVLGRKVVAFVDAVLGRTPIVRYIYSATRQVANSFRITKEASFRRVALVDFPTRGSKSIAFVTGRTIVVDGQRLVPVFVPTSPTPTSGFLIMVPENEVAETDLTVEEALRMVVSGGMAMPETLGTQTRGWAGPGPEGAAQ